jgi:hypothetical protein
MRAYPSLSFECNKNGYLIRVGIAGHDYGTESQFPNQEVYICRSTKWSRFIDNFTFRYHVDYVKKRKVKHLFDIDDYFETFGFPADKAHYTLEEASAFIHQYYMPIIRGEMWIDELLKQEGK